MNLTSMKEWVNSWGDGPNWSDVTGTTIPTCKTLLLEMIADSERMRDTMMKLRDIALDSRSMQPHEAATIATICNDVLEDMS